MQQQVRGAQLRPRITDTGIRTLMPISRTIALGALLFFSLSTHAARKGSALADPGAMEGREGAYLLGRPAEKILVTDVLWALRGPRHAPTDTDADSTSMLVSQLLDELEDAAQERASARTLADVLEWVPPAPAETEPGSVPTEGEGADDSSDRLGTGKDVVPAD